MIATVSPPQHHQSCTCGTLDLTCCHGGSRLVTVVVYSRASAYVPVMSEDHRVPGDLPDILDHDGPTDWSGVPWHLWPAMRRQAYGRGATRVALAPPRRAYSAGRSGLVRSVRVFA